MHDHMASGGKQPDPGIHQTPKRGFRRRLWWMAAKRFVKGFVTAGASAATALAYRGGGSPALWIISGLAGVAGGVGMATEKVVKEKRKAKGKKGWWERFFKELWDLMQVILERFKGGER